MKRVLINGTNLNGAGAQVIGVNLLPELVHFLPDVSFMLLLPNQNPFKSITFPNNVEIRYIERAFRIRNDLNRLRELLIDLPRLARLTKPAVCLTLGDLVPFKMPCPNEVLLHQALFVYNNSDLGESGWPRLKLLFLTQYFARTSRQTKFIVQTPVMADRLATKYEVPRQHIKVIPLPIPKHIIEASADERLPLAMSSSQKPIKLLFLASYYPHKNHAILPAVANELRKRNMADQVQIFVTLDEAVQSSAMVRGKMYDYMDVITNLGRLPSKHVAAALRASSGLFLPTLVESYGLIYLEAMICGVPILTSDRDFARWICQDLALYFDPLDPIDIVNIISSVPLVDKLRFQSAANQHLQTFPRDWSEVAGKYAEVVQQYL